MDSPVWIECLSFVDGLQSVVSREVPPGSLVSVPWAGVFRLYGSKMRQRFQWLRMRLLEWRSLMGDDCSCCLSVGNRRIDNSVLEDQWGACRLYAQIRQFLIEGLMSIRGMMHRSILPSIVRLAHSSRECLRWFLGRMQLIGL